jgi:hypothetical protein
VKVKKAAGSQAVNFQRHSAFFKATTCLHFASNPETVVVCRRRDVRGVTESGSRFRDLLPHDKAQQES